MPLFSTASGLPAEDVCFRWAFEWKPQDLWVGLFWKRIGNCVDVWVYFVPYVPLHLCWHWHDPAQ